MSTKFLFFLAVATAAIVFAVIAEKKIAFFHIVNCGVMWMSGCRMHLPTWKIVLCTFLYTVSKWFFCNNNFAKLCNVHCFKNEKENKVVRVIDLIH